MERKLAIAALFIVAMIAAAVIIIDQPSPDEENDRIYQIGTLEGLLNADYEGKISVSHLLEHGSYGLGTFEGLDGEMIVIDGECYRVANDGSVNKVVGSVMTPFASVANFDGDSGAFDILDPTNYTGLKEVISLKMAHNETFYLIVIHATFSELTVRSVPGQEVPYPPLLEVLEDQSVYYLTNVTGTLIGFYSPSFIGTIDQAGFHSHFINDDRTRGGHVLDLELKNAEVRMDQKTGLDLDLLK